MVSLYYDPEIEHSQGMNSLIGLGVAWYLLPYDAGIAQTLYRAAVRDLGLHDEQYNAEVRAPFISRTLTMHQLALVLAVELGDVLVEARLRPVLDVFAEPRHFGEGDFGFFYHLDEPWPRGQLSALLMVAEVGLPGAWRRLFENQGFRDRFSAPAVVGVDFPRLGISRAWNDRQAGLLTITTYVGTPSQEGTATTFRVVRVPGADLKSMVVTCDGKPYQNWVALSDSSLEIHTEVAEHTFAVFTGYHGPTGVQPLAEAPQSRL